MSFQITGTSELLANLRRINEGVRSQAAREAVEEGAAVIQYQGMANAPVRTSALRNSFRIESRTSGQGAVAEVGPHVIYARIQEFGGHTGRGHKTYINGKHYLERAVEAKHGQVISVMGDVIRDYLENQ